MKVEVAAVMVEVAAVMKSYLTSQDFKDIIAKAVKEAVGQAMESIVKELKAEIAVLEGKVKTMKICSGAGLCLFCDYTACNYLLLRFIYLFSLFCISICLCFYCSLQLEGRSYFLVTYDNRG